MGRMLYGNRALRTLLGYERGELTGKSVSLLVPERFREAHEQHVRAYAAHGEPRPMGSRPVLSLVTNPALNGRYRFHFRHSRSRAGLARRSGHVRGEQLQQVYRLYGSLPRLERTA